MLPVRRNTKGYRRRGVIGVVFEALVVGRRPEKLGNDIDSPRCSGFKLRVGGHLQSGVVLIDTQSSAWNSKTPRTDDPNADSKSIDPNFAGRPNNLLPTSAAVSVVTTM
mmetsp:Transcript_19920/g.48778  ORF Transcript_19920/g.48778 Transcript_19920/m.48778 type:complete len:109 (+) Transcript_19920:147-473(+)